MPERDSDILWLILLMRRIALMFVREVEERYQLVPTLRSKTERRDERRHEITYR